MRKHYLFNILSLAIALILSGSVAEANLQLKDFRVYAKENIEARASDYQGIVGAGRVIKLDHFAVVRARKQQALPAPYSNFNVYAGESVRFMSGGGVCTVDGFTDSGVALCDLPQGCQCRSSEGNLAWAGIASPRVAVAQHQVLWSQRISQQSLVNHRALSGEMDRLAAQLDLLPGVPHGESIFPAGRNCWNVFDVQADHFRLMDNLRFVGAPGQNFVIRVHGDVINFRRKGITQFGGVEPSRIIYYFPEARTLNIAFSGAPNEAFGYPVGIPGTVLAPNANVSFHEALITGGIYARNIDSSGRESIQPPNRQLQQQQQQQQGPIRLLNGGQVNFAELELCALPNPGQQQQQQQQQRPRATILN
jgi:choice-of-anchor A domain-containing protein